MNSHLDNILQTKSIVLFHIDILSMTLQVYIKPNI